MMEAELASERLFLFIKKLVMEKIKCMAP